MSAAATAHRLVAAVFGFIALAASWIDRPLLATTAAIVSVQMAVLSVSFELARGADR